MSADVSAVSEMPGRYLPRLYSAGKVNLRARYTLAVYDHQQQFGTRGSGVKNE